MVASKSPRNAAWEGLKRLMRDRVDTDASMLEIFTWGILPSSHSPRDPKEDRGHALVATAVVEQGLEYALSTKFIRSRAETRDQMFDSDGAVLRDLSAKARMAYMLGIIGKATRSDLSAIRRIRNTFAHTRLHIDFDTPEIVTACAQISLPERWPKMMLDADRDDAREIFLTSCVEFALWLFTVDYEFVGDPSQERFQQALLQG